MISKHTKGESCQEFVYLGYCPLNLNFGLFYESKVIELFKIDNTGEWQAVSDF